ncbi:MAG: hypothetical protein V7K38_28265 [Nostoc sp.]|uniref:hypothetical protein n=1 Tax=Nostoc sp. TaxID=1180 RepID=UPI002FF4A5C4
MQKFEILTRTNLLNWWQMRPIGWSRWRESSLDCRVWQTLNLLLLNGQYGVKPVTHSVHPI